MWPLLSTGVGLGLIDSLNPFTISAQAVLQALVKKSYHIWYYIFGTFISYFIGGLLVIFGIDKFFSTFYGSIMAEYSNIIFSLEITLGIGLVFLGAFLLYKKKKASPSSNKKEKKIAPPKSVTPLFLLFLGVSNTIGDLPTAIPYLIFIAQLVEASISMGSVLFLLLIYNIIYILPLVILFFLYIFNKDKVDTTIEKLRRKVANISEWAAIILPTAAGVFLGIHGYISLFA
ncbi:GAP family protein [Planococcus sp. N028]|uniref:GAP family protein n=1 Tax=Planococcus shixiaomingii TaxID=3058393 RepID=A0ABT8MYA9_9BACL|nr:GAP family protein [Planococcus sp. N028]MDN7240629.1 GAP family protein [Planococcus sp. N028]